MANPATMIKKKDFSFLPDQTEDFSFLPDQQQSKPQSKVDLSFLPDQQEDLSSKVANVLKSLTPPAPIAPPGQIPINYPTGAPIVPPLPGEAEQIQKTGKELLAAGAYMGAGAVKEAALDYDINKLPLGSPPVPFPMVIPSGATKKEKAAFSQKYPFDPIGALETTSLAKENISKNTAINVGRFIGATLPIMGISEGVGLLRGGVEATEAMAPLLSKVPAVLKNMVQAGIVGGIYGEARKPSDLKNIHFGWKDKDGKFNVIADDPTGKKVLLGSYDSPEKANKAVKDAINDTNRLHNALTDAASFIVVTGAGALLDKLVGAYLGRNLSLYNEIKAELIKKFELSGKTTEEAQKVVDLGMNEAIRQGGGWENVKNEDLKTALDAVKTGKDIKFGIPKEEPISGAGVTPETTITKGPETEPVAPPAPTSTIDEATIGQKPMGYLQKRFPNLIPELNKKFGGKEIPMDSASTRSILTKAASDGEEAIIRGATPEQATAVAIQSFDTLSTPVIEKTLENVALTRAGLPAFKPNDVVSRVEIAPGEFVNITHRQILEEAEDVRKEELEQWDIEKHSELDKIGKIRWTKALEELGDFKLLPWWVKRKFFSTNPIHEELGAKAEKLGISDTELIKKIVDYDKGVQGAPAKGLYPGYYMQALHNLEYYAQEGVGQTAAEPKAKFGDKTQPDLFGETVNPNVRRRKELINPEQGTLFGQQAQPQFEVPGQVTPKEPPDLQALPPDQKDLFAKEPQLELNLNPYEEKAVAVQVPQGQGETPAAQPPVRPAPRALHESFFAVKFKKTGQLVIPRQKIGSPADLAFIFKGISDPTKENFFIAALKKGKVVAVEQLGIGTIDQTVAYPFEVLNLISHTGADSIVAAHNHPSGYTIPSEEDKRLTRELRKIIENNGQRFLGHVIINDKKFGFIHSDLTHNQYDHSEYAKTKTVDVLQKYGEWVANRPVGLKLLTTPKTAFELFKGVQVGKDEGMAFILNTNNEIINSVIIPHGQFDTKTIQGLAANYRSKRFVLVNSNLSVPWGLKTLQSELEPTDIKILDDIVASKDPNETEYNSRLEHGLMEPPAKYSAQEKTPEFDKWFGNSKVVDEKGQPLQVYHQTKIENEPLIYEEGFSVSPKKARSRLSDEGVPNGIFFKPDRTDIKIGGTGKEVTQIPVYLSLQNPLIVSDRYELTKKLTELDPDYGELATKTVTDDNRLLREFDVYEKKLISELPEGKRWSKDLNDKLTKFIDDWSELNEENAGKARAKIDEILKKNGIDGVILEYDGGSFGRKTKTFIALRPEQIKSPYNFGRFDPNDPNILREKGAEYKPQEVASGLSNSIIEIKNLVSSSKAAPLASAIMREQLGKMARSFDKAEASLEKADSFFKSQPNEVNLDFIDKMERGLKQSTPELDGIAQKLRTLFDSKRGEVQALGTGKLQSFIENYFPHIWDQPEKTVSTAIQMATKRPLEGGKSFLKKRSIEFTKDGVEAGLTPVSWNPVELTLLKIREMDKYIMAHKTLNEYKANGLAKYVPVGKDAPEGFVKVNDGIGTIFKSPMIPIKEAYDQIVMKKLNAVADDLKIPHERRTNIGGTRWGYASPLEGVVTKFAGDPTIVLSHEIGHMIDFKYDLQNKMFGGKRPMADFILDNMIKKAKREGRLADVAKHEEQKIRNKELRDLADKTKVKNARKGEEKMATMMESLIHAPKVFKSTAPNTFRFFKDFLNSHDELKPLLSIEPGLELGVGTSEVYAGGNVITGHIWAQADAARIINNYLSPGLQKSSIYRAFRYSGNALNQFQLGFSAFHLGFTSVDSAVSKMALAINQLALGHPVKAIEAALRVPIAPIENVIRGDKLLKAWRGQGKAPIDEVYAEVMAMGGGRARMDQFYATKAHDQMMKLFKEGKIIRGLMRVPLMIMEASSKPILEWIVPRQKLGVFSDIVKMELENNPDMTHEQLRYVAGKAWDSVDNRMGQLVYDNLFWNRTLKDLLMASVRSVGWNLGTIREIGGGAIDIAKLGKGEKGRGANVSYRLAYLIALPITAGIMGAIYQYLRTGKGPQELKDYYFPKSGGTDANGDPNRKSLPSYMKDIYHYSTAPGRTILNKLNPSLAIMGQMLSNKDFYGVKIANEDDPLVKQVGSEALYLLKQMVPFGFRNAQRNIQVGNKSLSDILEPFIGITPAPYDVNQTPAERLAHRISAGKIPIGGRTQDAADRSRLIRDLENKMKANDPSFQENIQKSVKEGKISTQDISTITRKSHLTPLQKLVYSFSAEETQRVYDKATPEEQRQIKPMLMRKIFSQRMKGRQVENP